MLTLKIALRNVLLHKVKTLIIGFIIIFGTTLAIVGNAFVDAISTGMQRSLTNSVTGEIQVYSSDAKDKIAVLGNMGGDMPDIAHVNDFVKVRETLLAQVPNISAVIPMGTNIAMVSPGNILDVKLEELRTAYQAKSRDTRKITALKGHVRAILEDLQRKQAENKVAVTKLMKVDKLFEEAPIHLKKALSDEFWNGFDAQYESRIEFLANHAAPLLFDEPIQMLSYIGTVPESFKSAFSQFEIVKGQEIPEGKRGFLFSDYVYETLIKHRVARRLDQLKKKIEKEKLNLDQDKTLKDLVTANVAQAAEVYTQIDPVAGRELAPKLQKLLGSKTRELPRLVEEFLTMNGSCFAERFKFFYDQIAPHIILYKIQVGDVFPITAFTKAGYSSSVNMKVYGTYRFKSFESSPIAGNFNIMDMMSFRELFGFMTAEKREETRALEKEMGLADFGKDDMESMFQKAAPKAELAETPKAAASARAMPAGFQKFQERRRIFDVQYTRAEMENGVFLNAAILLKDPSRISQTLEKIQEVAKAEKLGIQAVDWKEAAGMIGQLTTMVRGLLYFIVLVTFGIATFIIMNSMLMATLERTREIGTMRAIGAQRTFLLRLFLQETFVLSFIFGLIGTLIGVTIVTAIGSSGIPAQGDVATFFFSGDRLFLSVNFTHILIVFVCMTLVAIVSTQYPAWRAMKILPLEAMQKSD